MVPLCMTVSTSRTQELWLNRFVYAGWFADLAGKSMDSGDRKPLVDEMERYRELYSERILVVDASGVEFANTGVDTSARGVENAVVAVRSNRHATGPPHRLRTWDPDTMLVASPIGSGLHIRGAVVIEASTVRAKSEITGLWALISLGASTALTLFTGVALGLSRWLLRPLFKLSDSVAALTETLPRPPDKNHSPSKTVSDSYGGYFGPPEIQELARSFDSMSTAVSDSVHSQRQLVADTAHAIRNPLAALAIRLQAMEKVIPEQARTSFLRASSQVDRLTAILDGLLKLAVAETPVGYDPAQSDAHWPDRCDVMRVVEDRVEEWQVAFEVANMTLTAEYSLSVIEAAIPADALAQILDIALSNSCRYAGSGAATEVRVRGESERATISVVDNGIGVSEDEITKLTTRFFRGASAVPGGTGLGLPIASALVQRYRGELLIAPVTPHGLHVALRLPPVKPERPMSRGTA